MAEVSAKDPTPRHSPRASGSDCSFSLKIKKTPKGVFCNRTNQGEALHAIRRSRNVIIFVENVCNQSREFPLENDDIRLRRLHTRLRRITYQSFGLDKKRQPIGCLFLAESVGFEPTWLAPNGFQDRLVMTASITLPVLYSLIYKRVKKEVGIDLSSRAVASQVFSAHTSLTTVFGMGTGGSSQLWTPTILFSEDFRIFKIE